MAGKNQKEQVPIHFSMVESAILDQGKSAQGSASFHIYREEHSFITPAENPIPHRHDFYEIFYVHAGQAVNLIDFSIYRAEAGMLFFTTPGQIHYWKGMDDLTVTVLRFREGFLIESVGKASVGESLELMQSVTEDPRVRLPDETQTAVCRLLDAMLDEYAGKKPYYERILGNYLEILLAELYRCCHERITVRGYRDERTVSSRFKRLVSQQVRENHSLPDYAEQLGLSTGYLADLVKKQTGYPPGEIIRQSIVLEAKRLLANTEMGVGEVADYLAFEDVSYFCRMFRRETGMTPAGFRKECWNRKGS